MLDVSRKELKYPVGLLEEADIRRRLSPFMREDEHNGQSGYAVRSLYFDTPHDRDFEEKVDGCDERQKIRLRIYGADARVIKLELKEKSGSAQRKRSLTVSEEEAARMMRAEYSFLMRREEKMAHWLYAYMVSECYLPKCIVEYDRYALIYDANDTRVTFDRNLRATESCLDLFCREPGLYPVSGAGEVTMEVKYNGFLMTFIKNELNISDRMQSSNSKYCRARMISKRGRK